VLDELVVIVVEVMKVLVSVVLISFSHS